MLTLVPQRLFLKGSILRLNAKSTYHSPVSDEAMAYSLDTGASGVLSVTIGSTTYVYKLSDIVGRIEAAQ